MISKTVTTVPLHIVMSLCSSSSMLNFYFCKVSLFFLVILPSFNCVPSLHHSSNLLSKNLLVLLLDNVKKYLDLSMKRGNASISNEEDNKIVEEMAGLKKRFEDKDWEELARSVPTYMKPMVLEQKKKYIK